MASDPKYCTICGASTHSTHECPGKDDKEFIGVWIQPNCDEETRYTAHEALKVLREGNRARVGRVVKGAEVEAKLGWKDVLWVLTR